MSRIMVTVAIDCSPIRRRPFQRHKKRFDGAPIDQDMRVRGKNRGKLGRRNRSQGAKSDSIVRLYYSRQGDQPRQTEQRQVARDMPSSLLNYFQTLERQDARISPTQRNTPGCSKRPLFSPDQSRRAEKRRSTGKPSEVREATNQGGARRDE